MEIERVKIADESWAKASRTTFSLSSSSSSRGGDLWILGHVLNPRLSGENKVAYLCSKPVERHLVAEQNRDEHVTVMLVTYDASPGPSSLFPPPRERIFRRQASRRRKKGEKCSICLRNQLREIRAARLLFLPDLIVNSGFRYG